MGKLKRIKSAQAAFHQKKNERGDAMILVLCILMLFMVLSLSILTAAAVVLGTTKRNAVSERCKTAASFSAMLEEQLVQERQNVPLRLQSFFMEMVQAKMQNTQPQMADFYWDEDSAGSEIPADLVHEIVITNGGEEMGELLNDYNISVNAVWMGSRELFQDAYDENNGEGKTEVEKLPNECCYSGIKLKVTTICENEKMRESYQATVYYNVWIEGTPGADAADVWKFTTGIVSSEL